jgi:hypothetical protein
MNCALQHLGVDLILFSRLHKPEGFSLSCINSSNLPLMFTYSAHAIATLKSP